MGKRADYITWDEYFMSIAIISSYRSKDPGTQVGCCIVSTDNKILSVGYNGFPTGCSDNEFPWDREAVSSYDTKYNYVVHAELNAILNFKGQGLKGAKVYTTLFPCNECAKALIQVGISEIIYLEDKYADTAEIKSSKRMLDVVNIKYYRYKPYGKKVEFKI